MAKTGRCVLSLLLFGLITGHLFAEEKSEPLESAGLSSGDHERSLMIDEQKRSYLIHVPESYDPKKRTPVVLALHGATMNGPIMAAFCGMSIKSEEAGFVVVYPSGTGRNPFLFWNPGGDWEGIGRGPDDRAFIANPLAHLPTLR